MLIYKDRVRETVNYNTETGALELTGPILGNVSFLSSIPDQSTFFFCFSCPSSGEWQVSTGIYDSAANTVNAQNTLAYNLVDSDNWIWQEGQKEVCIVAPAYRSGFKGACYKLLSDLILELESAYINWGGNTVYDISGIGDAQNVVSLAVSGFAFAQPAYATKVRISCAVSGSYAVACPLTIEVRNINVYRSEYPRITSPSSLTHNIVFTSPVIDCSSGGVFTIWATTDATNAFTLDSTKANYFSIEAVDV